MESNRPENIRGKSLDAMSTASLQALLQAELDSERDVDVDRVKKILAVLDARAEQKAVDVDAAWDNFLHNHLPVEPLYPVPEDAPAKKKGTRKRRLIRVAVVAAVLATVLLGVSLTASAAGYDIWNAVMLWSSETFGFEFDQNIGTSSLKSDPEYAELKKALVDAGITDSLVPNYLPDGYKQVEFYAENGSFFAGYKNGEHAIIIQIQEIADNNNIQHEKDKNVSEVYVAGGINHYISTNLDEYIAVWTSNGYECFISGVPSKKELLKMIDSIYTEER